MKLKLVKCDEMNDWFLIERAEHDGREWTEWSTDGMSGSFCRSARITDADVEGCGSEMLAIADAIERRSSARFKRCAVRIDGERAFFESPRNSRYEGECTLAEALELATEIRRVVSP